MDPSANTKTHNCMYEGLSLQSAQTALEGRKIVKACIVFCIKTLQNHGLSENSLERRCNDRVLVCVTRHLKPLKRGSCPGIANLTGETCLIHFWL